MPFLAVFGKIFTAVGGKLLTNALVAVLTKLITQRLIERIFIKFFIWLAGVLIGSNNNSLTHEIFQPVRDALVKMDAAAE